MSNKRLSILLSLFLVTLTVTWAVQATAYSHYDGSNNCSQCHPGFQGQGALHATHTAFVPSCFDCHTSIGDNPLISNCAACHTDQALWNFHALNAPADGQGLTCSNCHSFTANRQWSMGHTKASFR